MAAHLPEGGSRHAVTDPEHGCRVLAEAFDKDPSFYQFYRALKTYRSALADSGPTLVLSPDADFMRTLESGPNPPQSPPTPPAPRSAP